MKIEYWIAAGLKWGRQLILVMSLLVLLWLSPHALAEPVVADPAPMNRPAPSLTTPNLATPFWQKIQRLQEDRQLQQLVAEDLEKSMVIREQIQAEVDRAFEHTTTLLNVLLVVLTMIPILAAPGIWFIRRSVISQISAETKKQLQEEAKKQLEAEISTEVRKQADAFQKELDRLKDEFGMQLAELKSLFLDAEQEKDLIIQELAQITPSPMRDLSNSPEIHQKVQELTRQLELLKANNSRLFFTANDYVEQGKAFYFEARYEDAIAAHNTAIQLDPENSKACFSKGAALAKLQRYDEAIVTYEQAIQIDPDFSEAWFGQGAVLTKLQRYKEAVSAYEKATLIKPSFYLAWFGKARCYALNGDVDLALESLQQAIELNADKSKEAAKTDFAFEQIREQEAFQALVES